MAISKSKKSPPASSPQKVSTKAETLPKAAIPPKATRANSKQATVIAMLSKTSGTTIPAIMKTTGWQPHSVRGFLAGVVRKKLGLKLESNEVDDKRVYRIVATKKTAPKITTATK